MELYPPEHKLLETIVQNWVDHPLRECEATFGSKEKAGQIDGTAFLAVAQRLRGKGYTALPQEDRLTVTTPDNNRFTLSGMGVIQQYCRDNRMAGKPYVAITKDRASNDPPLELDDYDTTVKVRNEIPLPTAVINDVLASWAQQKKAFRLIRRWSFEGDGFQFDLSIVYSTFKDAKGNYKWVRNFQDQNIRGAPPTYEIEVELKRTPENAEKGNALKSLIKGVGEVLRGLQKNTLLIRRSMKEKVLNAYKLLTKEERFRGVAPVTLELKNMLEKKEESVPSLYDGYNVTDKADGLRVLGFTDSKGELFMIDMALNVYRTGLKRESCKDSLLDGEWVTVSKEGKGVQQLLFFDMYINVKEKVDSLPFEKAEVEQTRHKLLNKWVSAWNDGTGPDLLVKGLTAKTRLQVSAKKFEFGAAGDKSIFHKAAVVLKKTAAEDYAYNTDGLIFTPNESPLPERAGVGFLEQFKWKPAHDNTIDFLVTIQKEEGKEKEDVIIKEGTGETVTYKTLRLFVGSSADPAYNNPRDTVLFEREMPKLQRPGAKRDYKPVLFNPKEFPDTVASICYRELIEDPSTNQQYISTDRSMEPIQDKSIVEMAYDPSQLPGWRWRPVRVRHDKTERFQRGIVGRTLNSDMVAESVWNSIHEPITETMIKTGAEVPSAEESAALRKSTEGREGVALRYVERKAAVQDLALIRGLRDFHNRYIKEDILLDKGLMGKNKTLVDFAVGKAADAQKWRRNNVGFVFGVDIAGESILNADDGAYRRYLNTLVNARGATIPPMIFAIGDSAKSIASGEAGATEEERDIMRAVYGQLEPSGPVPPYVTKFGKGKLKNGADCAAIMFALHYLFKDEAAFNGLLENIRDSVKVGGYFVGCCFDGEAVFELLRNVKKGEKKVGMERGANIWTLVKQYDQEEMPVGTAAFGMAVDVEFISIGASHREYLVPFSLLTEKLATIGLELLDASELKAIGLQNSTNMFEESYKMAAAAGKKYEMSDVVKQYSFLNRWFIFKRKGSQGKQVEVEEESTTPKYGSYTPKTPVYGQELAKEIAKKQPAVRQIPKDAIPIPGIEGAYELPIVPFVEEAPVPKLAAAPPAKAAPPPSSGAPVPRNTFEINDLIQFHIDITPVDKLKLGDKTAARWLSPIAPFPISDDGVEYPSLEHFIGAMKYKVATNQPNKAPQIFGSEGSIHQAMLRKKLSKEIGGKTLTEDELFDLYKEEMEAIRTATKPAGFKVQKATYDEGAWAANKRDVLLEGLRQRWENDARFRRIVEAARNQGKHLLYYTGATGTSDLGGVYRPKEKKIEGDNLLAKLIMELAGFPGA
jgi:predicted NAD-dependent protein-ADP-ribosyltransferase YbiA (DUF1768 family)